MGGNGRRVTGIVLVVVSVLAALWDVLLYMGHHPRRWPVILIVCGLIFILGIVLVVLGARPAGQAPRQ